MISLNRLSLKIKMLAAVVIACGICALFAVCTAIYFKDVEFKNGLIEKSRTIHSRVDAVAKYVGTQGGLAPMIEKFKHKYKTSAELTDADKNVILQQVPIYAAMKVAADGAEKERYEFRVFSNEPRNEKNAATAQEAEVFRKFEGDANLKEFVADDGKKITVYRPVRLDESRGCLTCHGAPSSSPWGDGKDILGYKMEDWKDGKLHGVFAISSDLAAVKQYISQSESLSSSMYLGILILVGGLIALVISMVIVSNPINTLQKVTSTLSESGEHVASAANQIASSSHELSQAANEQAVSLERTTSAIEEMSSMVERNSQNAKNTATTSSNSRDKAERGKEVVEQMIQAMNDINQSNDHIMNQINHSNNEIFEIVRMIQEIGDKTKVINDIVFQTKLLSFNASVEAARAGEHGKGFAVVAEEVGNLAQMSGNAAKEISTLLEGSIQKVENIVNETRTKVDRLVSEGKNKVYSGTEVAHQCGEVLNEIVDNVNSVSQMASEISVASQEQSQGVQEINKAVSQLDQVTQQNAATSEVAASAAAALSAQAKSLKASVEQLAATIYGDV